MAPIFAASKKKKVFKKNTKLSYISQKEAFKLCRHSNTSQPPFPDAGGHSMNFFPNDRKEIKLEHQLNIFFDSTANKRLSLYFEASKTS